MVLAGALLVAGMATAPAMVTGMTLVQHRTPEGRLNEGMTLAVTGLLGGIACGAAAGGWVVEHVSATAGYGVPVAAAATALLISVTSTAGRPAPDRGRARDPSPGPAPVPTLRTPRPRPTRRTPAPIRAHPIDSLTAPTYLRPSKRFDVTHRNDSMNAA